MGAGRSRVGGLRYATVRCYHSSAVVTGTAGMVAFRRGKPVDLPAYPSTLWGLLAGRADRDPDRVLLEDDRDATLTAAEWVARAERVAAALLQMGIKEGTVVSWQLPTSIDSCLLVMALARIGAVQNPVIPLLRRREVGFIVNQIKAEVLITRRVWRNFDYEAMARDIADETGISVLVFDDEGLPEADPAPLPPPPTGDGDPPSGTSTTRPARPPTRRGRATPTCRS